jgi:hypothetical protein
LAAAVFSVAYMHIPAGLTEAEGVVVIEKVAGTFTVSGYAGDVIVIEKKRNVAGDTANGVLGVALGHALEVPPSPHRKKPLA